MHLFQPKHQKLILQCYPPGRSFDKKPNSSELSYLLYYASTRRVKLEKVGQYLQKKNESDVYRNRTGNIQVTLDIINALIKKCPDDLNVFAPNVNAILKSVLKTKDLSLCQHAEPVFASYCSTLDVDLFTGDLEFVHNFTELTESFLNLEVNVSKANTNEWRAISLKVAGSLAEWKNVSQNTNSLYIVKKAIALIASEISNDFTEENLLKRTVSHSSETQQFSSERLSKDLARFNTIKTLNTKKDIVDNQSTIGVELDDLAIKSLRNYFSTNSSTKLASSTVSLTEYLIKTNSNISWASALIELVITWAPVQLRFLVLSILTSRLDKNGKTSEQSIYIHSISRLLSSSINLVGLSVIDNLKQFVTLQKHYILNSNETSLIAEYTTAIESLAAHIYYQDQIIDIVGELLSKIKETDSTPLTLFFINDISKVLIRAFNSKSIQRSLVPIEIFADTFGLLSNEIPEVQKAYIELLVIELDLEYREKPQYLKSDYDSLISSGKLSVLNLFYEQVESIILLHSQKEFLTLLELINTRFGINAGVNFIPFFFQFQLKEKEDQRYSKQEILIDNVGYANIYFGAKVNGLADILAELLSKISYRKSNNLWILDEFPKIELPEPSSELLITKDSLTKLISSSSSLKEYQDLILSSHYKYNLDDVYNPDKSTAGEDANDFSFVSNNNTSQSFANFLQDSEPPTIPNNDTHSIKSMPFSARSILVNGKLNIPKVNELRNVISGTQSQRIVTSTTTYAKTDIATLLEELNVDSELEDRGKLVNN